jgi:hypothetical protein
MPTTEQLRSALYAREQHAGDIEPLLARALAERSRRPSLAPVLVAALVLVLAATIVVIAQRPYGSNSPAGTTDPAGYSGSHPLPLRALRFALTGGVADLTVSEASAGAGEQSLLLHPTGTRLQLQLLVYAPGNPDATPFALRGVRVGDAVPGLQSVEVQGRPGYLGTLSDPHDETPGTADYPGAAVAWQYRSGAWAVLEPDGLRLPSTQLLQYARGVDFGANTALRTAVTLSAEPDGLRLAGLDLTYPHGGYERAIVDYASPDGSRTIAVSVEQTGAGAPATGRRVTVDHRVGHWTAYGDGSATLAVELGHGQTLTVSSDHTGLTLARATAVARTATVATRPGTLSTWLPAAKLP